MSQFTARELIDELKLRGFSGTLTYNSSSFPSWLSMTETSSTTGHKVFSLVVPRTEVAVAKTFVIEFEDDYNSVGVRVNQAAGRSTWILASMIWLCCFLKSNDRKIR